MQFAARKDIVLDDKGDTKTRKKRERALEDELDILVGLQHPHIVKYLSHEKTSSGLLSIFTEFCYLGDLQRYIHQRHNGYTHNSCEIGGTGIEEGSLLPEDLLVFF